MDVVIEISKNSRLKYEYDEDTRTLKLDRVLHNTNRFPYNYGFIPNTLAPDNDAVDVIVLSSHELHPGCVANVRIVGGIVTEDENGRDDKIICVLGPKIDTEFSHIHDITDVHESTMTEIIYFLTHYKDGEANKFVKLGERYGREDAIAFIDKCMYKI